MKSAVAIITCWLIGATMADEVLHLHSGDALPGKIEKIDNTHVHFKVIIDGPRGRGEARRRVARKDIAFIDFAGPDKALDNHARKQWLAHKKFLGIANSPAGDHGLAYVSELMAAGKGTEALRLANEIAEGDWDADRRDRAIRWRLKALASIGRETEAKGEAEKLLQSTTDPEVMVEAHLILGQAAFASLRELVEAHPRWMDEDTVRPERDALYHAAIDHFLFGSLFHGSQRQAASEGLWQACQVHRHANDRQRARDTAQDLLSLYPTSALTPQAQAFLSQTDPAS